MSTTKDKKPKDTSTVSDRYTEAVGRRKMAIARVRIFEDNKQSFLINDRELDEYFPTNELQNIVKTVFSAKIPDKFKITVVIRGGGISSQAEAIRLGIARALEKFKPELRKNLKKAGHLKRDPRVKERKKFGLKKARKAAQWSKR